MDPSVMLAPSLNGSNSKADLLNVIQKHIVQSMEVEKETENKLIMKVEELNRTNELNSKLQNELIKVNIKEAYCR